MIILDENKWAKTMIDAGDLGKKPAETLRCAARYYLDGGLSRREVEKNLEELVLMYDPGASLPKWSGRIEQAIKRAIKHPAVHIDCVEVTDTEIARIEELSGKQIQRLAFTLLCLAKYWYLVSPGNDYWVDNKDGEISAMANINTSVLRRSQMYHTLYEAGMIQFSRKIDNTGVRICYADKGNPVMYIRDFRNLGYQYMMYHGEPYFVCQNCGVTAKTQNPQNNRKPKYCRECAAKIYLQQTVNSVMRSRGKLPECVEIV